MVSRGLCTHFQLVLFTRPDCGHQGAGEETLRDPRVDIVARKDLLDFIHALNGEQLVTAIVNNGQRPVDERQKKQLWKFVTSTGSKFFAKSTIFRFKRKTKSLFNNKRQKVSSGIRWDRKKKVFHDSLDCFHGRVSGDSLSVKPFSNPLCVISRRLLTLQTGSVIMKSIKVNHRRATGWTVFFCISFNTSCFYSLSCMWIIQAQRNICFALQLVYVFLLPSIKHQNISNNPEENYCVWRRDLSRYYRVDLQSMPLSGLDQLVVQM